MDRERERELIRTSRVWPCAEAVALLERVERRPPSKGHVLFETGYGPSGLPHIGTFAEVFRTTLVRQAFRRLSDLPTRLYCFSDDMDGLRKIPDNVPRPEMLQAHLGKPLTAIPDPFGEHESYGHHMNARLRAFLDAFGFDYEFVSATDCYRSGRFDPVLRRVLEKHEEIRRVVLPHLREERRRTYSPILPISPRTGRVLQVPILEVHPERGTVVFRDEDGTLTEVPVTGGHCKLQWRADWALRWTALEVDYEMAGKDLIDSVRLSGQICRILGGTPPNGFIYELFLDEKGEKISKSKGNGLTIEEWLRYGTKESLMMFLFKEPRKAKRLYFDVIPRHVDEYYERLEQFARDADLDGALARLLAEPAAQVVVPAELAASLKLEAGPVAAATLVRKRQELGTRMLQNPVWHLHDGAPPRRRMPLSYAMLLNLAAVVGADEPALLWGFVRKYAPEATPENSPELSALIERALAYYRDFIAPHKRYRAPDHRERAALEELRAWLATIPEDTPAEVIQNELYEIGRRHGFHQLRDWFRALYEVLLGQSQGPRFGSFIATYGVQATVELIDHTLARHARPGAPAPAPQGPGGG